MQNLYSYLYNYLFICFNLQQYLISLKHNENLSIIGHRKSRILQSVDWWQKMHDLRIKWNQACLPPKQHSKGSLFDRKLGLKFKAGTSRMLSLVHSFVCCGSLESCRSKSELFRTFWNAVLQKGSGDQLDWSGNKWRGVTKNPR